MAYVTQLPDLDTNHVQATSMRAPNSTDTYYPHQACNTASSLINSAAGNAWISHHNEKHDQRIWANLGATHIITRLSYSNYHDSQPPTVFGTSNAAGSIHDGAYEGSIWGSNIQPEAYGTYNGLAKLWESNVAAGDAFIIHSPNNVSDVHTIDFSNATPYQYYTIDVNNNQSGNFGIGFRRIEWQENI